MDKLKSVRQNGWKPSGDRPIHRETWKSDLKGMATGKKQDPYAHARDHQSAPLATLKDPDAFGPPPKHKEFYPDGDSPSQSNQPARWTASSGTGVGVGASVSDGPSGGLGSVVPMKSRQQRSEEAAQKKAEEVTLKRPSGPFQIDSTGLRTDNLPKPPVRRNGPDDRPAAVSSPAVPPRSAALVPLPPRVNTQPLPPRQTVRPSAPPPVLPPRQNEYPDEHTPAPPPPYHEVAQQPSQSGSFINQSAVNRLGQAGVSVAGFGIGGQPGPSTSAAAHAPQVSELQQRFARMNTSTMPQTSHSPPSPLYPSAATTVVSAVKKGPPPPPPKKVGLVASVGDGENASVLPQPPPLPLSSKPRPT